MTNFFNKISAMCKNASKQRETQLIDEKINQLIEKKNQLIGNNVAIDKKQRTNEAKSKHNVTCNNTDLITNVAANVQVKDICRNIERKLKRNLNKNDKDDWQMLYNHLFYFYSLKHVNTLPEIHGRNKTYHINDYVAMRVNSVINDVTCHVTFGK